MKSITLLCPTAMPFGVPVEPEVKLIYKGSVSIARARTDESSSSSISLLRSSDTETTFASGKVCFVISSHESVVTMIAAFSTL